MTREERKERALKLKGDRKIYYGRDLNCPIGLVVEIDDLSRCEQIGDGRWITSGESSPDWLYEILEIFGYGTTFDELMESSFEFYDEETMKEIEEICDVIVEY